MDLLKIQSGIDRTRGLRSRHQSNPPLDSVIKQLEYLAQLTAGETKELSKLKAINSLQCV